MPEQDRQDRLARGLVEQDEAAFLEFAETFGPQFLRYFIRHGLPYFEAEDLAASCVTDIALKAGRYRSEAGRFSAWAFTLAKNRLVDHQRSAARATAAQREDPGRIDEEPWSDVEIAMDVQEALGRLSELDRMLVQGRYFGSPQPFKTLAGAAGISEEAARVRCLRARRQLEALLLQAPAVQRRMERTRKRTA